MWLVKTDQFYVDNGLQAYTTNLDGVVIYGKWTDFKAGLYHIYWEPLTLAWTNILACYAMKSINKDLTVWLDGARPPPEYIFKNNISSMDSLICHTTGIFCNF